MIDRNHALSLTRQARAAGAASIICRDLPRPPILRLCTGSTDCISTTPLREAGCCKGF